MSGSFLSYLGSVSVALWGAVHLVPTRNVVAGFGDISLDNKRILAMEWITEGVALLFIGVLVGTVTWLDRESTVSFAVYCLTSTALLVLAAVSVFTGFRVSFLPYKLCPFIFGASAALILAGAFAG
jgi:hypothetical protein